MLSKFRFLRAKCVREFLMRQYSKLTVVNALILDFSFKELAKSIFNASAGHSFSRFRFKGENCVPYLTDKAYSPPLLTLSLIKKVPSLFALSICSACGRSLLPANLLNERVDCWSLKRLWCCLGGDVKH